MYDRRFHKWGVSKYVKRAKPTQSKPRNDLSRPPPLVRRNEMPLKQEFSGCGTGSEPDVWRTPVHLIATYGNPGYDDSVESQSSESSDATICGSWMDSKDDMSDATWFRTSASSPASSPCSCDDCHHHHIDESTPAIENSYEVYCRTAFGSLNIAKPLPRDSTAFDMEHVLSSLKTFCSSHFDTPSNVHHYQSTLLPNPTSSVVRQTWMQLHDCIYLFKLNDTRRAITALEEIRRLPPSSLIDHSPQVALEVVASLAPINTTRYPYVRSFILSHVLAAARSELGTLHPITTICAQLSRDGDIQDVSRRALSCLAQLISHKDAAFRLRVRLAAVDMLRREQDYAAAIRLAKEILQAAEKESGIDSPQRRRAARKLTHVYLDSGDYTRALELCRSVVGRQTAASAFSFQDYDAVRGMEDLAEVHRLRGEFHSSSLWLSAAADLSARLLGRSLTTVHIVDKLLDMTEKAGQKGDCVAYQRTYASFL
ncbi:hypothetical protein CONLIGDRAFT_390632 [Coniochaeta ligniaria NRRL 30616]|uniref:Uncharacterized protein n=1 Tax=Coniochaeta ligniaria NRRL 30616 TaxID=1408157 RepID=A0A1J7INF7_9PEZI|nr:hypothetical protein CONLIGDRAFT_390632 [Coniochaeta ligniaria NRRL 30616]